LLIRRATQHNLAAVLDQVNREHWEASPFLIKAVSMHGSANQPPIKSRQSAAFRSLEDWVRSFMANNPQVQEHASASTAALKQASHEFAAEPKPPSAKLEPPPDAVAMPMASPSTTKPGLAPGTSAPKPADPYDPAIFNQSVRKK
jgi:hypothetical protein